ncbi:MAG: hypothetical protein MHMPM18_005067, partial [Marteilia pararefringens]
IGIIKNGSIEDVSNLRKEHHKSKQTKSEKHTDTIFDDAKMFKSKSTKISEKIKKSKNKLKELRKKWKKERKMRRK